LGYTLFDSPDEGVVDIDAEFTSIIDKVEKEGATLATFWEIQSVANKLRDGHLAMPNINANDLSGDVFFLPERCADGAVKTQHSFLNDPVTGDLQLKIEWEDENGAKSESVVESMDGMSPYEFFVKVSNSPSIENIRFQSRGARFNALLMEIRRKSDSFGEYSQLVFPFITNARPSDAYPPEVLVKYADGSEEMYSAYLLWRDVWNFSSAVSTDSTVDLNVTALEEFINRPGKSYVQMEQAINGTLSVDVVRTIPRPRSKDVELVRSGAESEGFFFDHHDETGKAWAMKFMDGYAILKVESFQLNPESFLKGWKLLCQECNDRGIKKLVVDISNNGGGRGIIGMGLVTAMYPTASHDWYKENNALVINEPMQIYRDKISPLLVEVLGFVQNDDDATDEALLTIMEGLTDSRLKQVSDTIVTLKTFCDEIECLDDCVKQCDDLDNFQQVWTAFADEKDDKTDGPFFKVVIKQMVDLMKAFNRFSYWEKIFENFDSSVINTVNQGGVQTNLTDFFTDYTSDLYDIAAESSRQNNADFDEYIVLSNGAAASTAQTFSSRVIQIWNNRDKTQVTAKLTTVSYGGLKEDNGDVTMAGITAFVQDVQLQNEFIAAGVAYLFNHYILDGYEIFDAASSALDEYYESLSKVPYFANTLPMMPVAGDYDTPFMGDDTVPLQYIKMPADKHIPKYYLGTKIQDNSDLGDLYEEAAKFFSVGSDSALHPQALLRLILPLLQLQHVSIPLALF
jgi:hypothetical protein